MSKYKDFEGKDTLRVLKDKLNENNNSVEKDISNLQSQITTNENDIEAKQKAHLESTKAHKAEHITYTGNVAGQSNVKGAIDNVQSQVKSIVNSGTNSDARVSQALVDSESTTHTTLKDRNDKWEARVKEIEYQTKEAKYTDELVQEADIFNIGTGKNSSGHEVDVSSSVVNGQVSDVKLEGRTYNNEVTNGNFKNELSGWNHRGTHSKESIIAGYLRSTKDTSRPYVGRFDRSDIPTNSKLYIAFIARGNAEGRVIFRLHSVGLGADNVGSQPFTVNTTDTYCNTIITNLLPVNGFSIDGDSYTLDGDYIEIKEPIIINLTQLYGVGNEPTLDECNKIFKYIDGIKSTVSATRIKSIGKNLVNPQEITLGSISSVNGGISYSGVNFRTGFIRVNESSNYPAPWGNRHPIYVASGIRCYDENKNYLGVGNLGSMKLESGTKYIRLIGRRIDSANLSDKELENIKKEFQFEKGSTVTPYEPYKESITYISAKDETGKLIELHSLHFGIATTQTVKDEVNIIQKKSLKRVKKYILQESDILSVADRYGIYRVITRKFTDNHPWSNEPRSSPLKVVNYPVATFTEGDLWYTEDNIGKYFTQNDQTLSFLFPSGTTLPQAKSQLAGTAIYYQLAEPKTYDLDIEGSLESFPNGTMYIDSYIADSFQYTDTGITLPYPVSAIDKVETIVNGKLEEINLATVTLNADSKTVAITGAAKGKVYKIYTPIKSEESTRGTIKYKAPLNTSTTLMDTNALSNSNKKDIDYVKDLTNAYIIQNEYELALTKARLDTIETKINTP